MKHSGKYLLLILSVIITGFILYGCGGGGGSLTSVPVSEPTAVSPTPSGSAETGTFTITLSVPDYITSKDMSGSVLPYRAAYMRVSITGEAITGSITDETAISPPTTTLVINNVPPGLNEAVIEIRTASGGGGELLAQRKHGFFMPSGGSAGVGTAGEPFSMGVAIQEGVCVPANIDVHKDELLYFENRDAVQRTVTTSPASIVDGTIDGAEISSQPNVPATYHAKSHTFGTAGTYSYTSPSASGRVLVYDTPHMTAISDNDENPIEDTTTGNIATFTISGNGFGTDRTMVNGAVYFYRVDNLTAVYLDATSCISNWTDESITLSNIPGTSLPKGKYRVKVLVRGTYTPEDNFYYYKGSGNYVITVE